MAWRTYTFTVRRSLIALLERRDGPRSRWNREVVAQVAARAALYPTCARSTRTRAIETAYRCRSYV